MNFQWSVFIDLGIVGVGLLLATMLRARIRFFQAYLIPNAIIAGLLLLPFYNWIGPQWGIDQRGLEHLVFHLLNLTFIAIALRPTKQRQFNSRNILGTSTVIISQFVIQGIIGFTLTFVFIALPFLPSLFPSYGFLATLGYTLGPAQAFSIGLNWHDHGFADASSLGLIFGAIGFLVACFGGIWLINLGVRRGYINLTSNQIQSRRSQSGLLTYNDEKPTGLRQTTHSEAIDSLSLMLATIFGIYLTTYLLLHLITGRMSSLGGLFEQLANSLWGITFIFSLLVALIFKKLLKKFRKHYLLDEQGLVRISGSAVDFMMAAALGAVSVTIAKANLFPIMVFSLLLALVAFATIIWLTSRLFVNDFTFERVILFWGSLTGTLTTGLALLRVVDPEFKTPAASDYLYASAVTFFLVIPLIVMMELPALAYSSGNKTLYLISIGILLLYLISIAIGCRLLFRSTHRASKSSLRPLWFRSES